MFLERTPTSSNTSCFRYFCRVNLQRHTRPSIQLHYLQSFPSYPCKGEFIYYGFIQAGFYSDLFSDMCQWKKRKTSIQPSSVLTLHYAVTYSMNVNAVLVLGIAGAMAHGIRVLCTLEPWRAVMRRLNQSWKDAELIELGYGMTVRVQTVWAVSLNTLKIPQYMCNLPTIVNKRQQLWMWDQRQSVAVDSLKPLVCAVMYLVRCCSSRLLPQVSSASPVARAPSLSCLSQQCVPFMC